MCPRSSTESYPAFARIGLRENPRKNLNQHPVRMDVSVCNNRDSGAALAMECTLKKYASSSGRVKVESLFLSEPQAVKMCAAIASPARCEVLSVIRFIVAKNCKASEIHRQLCEVYGPDVISEGGVRQWCCMFKNGRTNVHDEERSCRPSIVNADLIRLVDERVRVNRRFIMKTWLGSKRFDDDEELKISVVDAAGSGLGRPRSPVCRPHRRRQTKTYIPPLRSEVRVCAKS
ncbi:hypothetical protein ANN_20707 [Periplaneta americana]|uniref:Mos1 transposase HTH domain-containing protein n=1 Tax=Periplaneta americana TaxID=6978 RepID=A0ABQ8SDN0_PERAM|nr:hypothetical protein ANN_20707 [Periplaneta americana]